MSEKYISLAEVRELLTKENEKREVEFNAVQKSAMAHAQTISKISPEQAQEIVDEVLQVGDFVTEAVAFKIADILPKYPHSRLPISFLNIRKMFVPSSPKRG